MWDHLREKYYQEWLESNADSWSVIRLKLDMVKDLRQLLRTFDNA